MEPVQFIKFLGKIEKLKSVPRHCVTSDGIKETVAAHSFRITLMAFLLKHEFPKLDMNRVMDMCIIHDLGEAVTGDIPSFEKTEEHEEEERKALVALIAELPENIRDEMTDLYAEMEEMETKEAKLKELRLQARFLG